MFASSIFAEARIVSRFDGEKFSSVKPRLPGYAVYSGWGWKQTVWQDREGAWWIPNGVGLFRSAPKTGIEELAKNMLQKVETGAAEKEVFRLFEDSRGDVWIAMTGNNNELLRWERAAGIWRDYTREAGFSFQRIGTAFVEDRAGNLWIGTGEDDSALIRYRDGQFKVFTRADSVPRGWIRDLFEDDKGRL